VDDIGKEWGCSALAAKKATTKELQVFSSGSFLLHPKRIGATRPETKMMLFSRI
jgi:hypothetical protein